MELDLELRILERTDKAAWHRMHVRLNTRVQGCENCCAWNQDWPSSLPKFDSSYLLGDFARFETLILERFYPTRAVPTQEQFVNHWLPRGVGSVSIAHLPPAHHILNSGLTPRPNRAKIELAPGEQMR